MIEEEPVKKFSKKEQIRLDEEFAFKIQAEEQEEERIAREKAQKIQEANIAWDDIQATVEADYYSKKAEEEMAQESSSKRAGTELEQEVAKKQKIDDDQEEAYGDSDRSSKRYSSMIKMLQNINREDLETLWKLVKAKHRNTRPKEGYERVLWGDLKVMFEPDIESEVWRSLEGHNVTVWKLFDSCGVHFVIFKNLHIFMLVENRYPLTPATITGMLNKKLQADHWNEMCYKLLKLITK
ncbi:hypothetical protein Tco_0923489 [Tanacetum coccineum]|uniref:Uncharacterized protein n=1 Tax=Tanacetum coccineum TaxID=301880 RepID=A0ABQ5D2H3_9ASTR